MGRAHGTTRPGDGLAERSGKSGARPPGGGHGAVRRCADFRVRLARGPAECRECEGWWVDTQAEISRCLSSSCLVCVQHILQRQSHKGPRVVTPSQAASKFETVPSTVFRVKASRDLSLCAPEQQSSLPP
jgi:hypothetical protein